MNQKLRKCGCFWTVDEVERLCLEYRTKGAIRLSEELGRTYNAVQAKAQSLGITRKDVSGKNNPMYGKHSGNYIPMETRTCAAPGCSNTFECKVNSKRKYCLREHSRLGKKDSKETNEKRSKSRTIVKAFRTKWCRCGCGGQFKEDSRYPQQFIHGHNGKVSNHSDFMKKLWQDPEYVAKQMKARKVYPNKTEKFLEELLQELLPNEWKYVGDGQFLLGGKCPDFVNINGQKKIIELFGEHVHKPEEEQERINLFAQYGFQSLVIWYSELKNHVLLEKKLLHFNNKG